MKTITKVWIIRIGSLPVLFYLPIFCSMPGPVILRENDGDSMPWLTAGGFLLGFAAAAVLSRWTLFMPRSFSVARSLKVLVSIILFECAIVFGLWLWVRAAEKKEAAEPGELCDAKPSHDSC